jgi:predicted DNA-binding transcriptional regulator AlpA
MVKAVEHTMKFIRYADLVERGIVSNRVTLSNWIQDQGFPPGRLLSPHIRAWTEQEVEDWLATRPVAGKPANDGLRRAQAASRRKRAERQAEQRGAA